MRVKKGETYENIAGQHIEIVAVGVEAVLGRINGDEREFHTTIYWKKIKDADGNETDTRSKTPLIHPPCSVHCFKDEEPMVGSCCCNCKHHAVVISHPWVDGNPCVHEDGWVCTVRHDDPEDISQVMKSRRHGLCELHEVNENKEEDEDHGTSHRR